MVDQSTFRLQHEPRCLEALVTDARYVLSDSYRDCLNHSVPLHADNLPISTSMIWILGCRGLVDIWYGL